VTFDLFIQIFIGVIGGLGLFLLGMKNMSEGMQAVAGERLRRLIRAVTDNRLVACGVGASVTALIQSSSVTTVMVVGMVNAGIMTLRQAIGVVMGTNIGTTITAWLIALHVADYGLPILGIAALIYLFSKSENVQYTAMVFVGLGMVFFGLELMKEGLSPLREMPEVINALSAFRPTGIGGLIKCIFVGSLMTALVQSSSATVAITITLANTGTIGYDTAVALVLGENIGTTVTASLASLGANTSAKRTAFAHFLFNVIGAVIIIPFFHIYLSILKTLAPASMAIAARIAIAHSCFNVFIVTILLPVINPYTRLVMFFIKGSAQKETPHLKYLDIRLLDSPAIAIQQSFEEIKNMGDGVKKMFDWLKDIVMHDKNDKEKENKIFHRENVLDVIQKEVVEFISKIMTGTLSHTVAIEARQQLRIADEYESISDYLVTILKLSCKMRNNELTVTDAGKKEVNDLHDMISDYFILVSSSVQDKNPEVFSKAQSKGDAIDHKIKNIRMNHLNRLEKNETTPLVSLAFVDMLTSYRRIKDHTYNVAEVIAGEK